MPTISPTATVPLLAGSTSVLRWLSRRCDQWVAADDLPVPDDGTDVHMVLAGLADLGIVRCRDGQYQLSCEDLAEVHSGCLSRLLGTVAQQ